MSVCRPVRLAESGDAIVFKVREREVTVTYKQFTQTRQRLVSNVLQLAPVSCTSLDSTDLVELFSRSWDEYKDSLSSCELKTRSPSTSTLKSDADWNQSMTFFVLYKPFGALMRAIYDVNPEIVVALYALILDHDLCNNNNVKHTLDRRKTTGLSTAARKKALLQRTLMSCNQRPIHACFMPVHVGRQASTKVVFDRFLRRCTQLLRIACDRVDGFVARIRDFFSIDVNACITRLEEACSNVKDDDESRVVVMSAEREEPSDTDSTSSLSSSSQTDDDMALEDEDEDDTVPDTTRTPISIAQARSSLHALSTVDDTVYHIGYVKSDLRGLVARAINSHKTKRQTVRMHDFSVFYANPVSASRTVGKATVHGMPDRVPEEFEVFAESFLMLEHLDPCVRMVGSVHKYADSLGLTIQEDRNGGGGGACDKSSSSSASTKTMTSVERVVQILGEIDRIAFRNGVLELHPYKRDMSWLRSMPMDDREERGA